MWSQSRTISPSNFRLHTANSQGQRDIYKRVGKKLNDYHASPIALQEAAMKRKTNKLDDLPMKYSLAESRSIMASQRSDRCRTVISVRTTRDESVNLCNLGKRLFNDAVDRATSWGSTEPSTSSDSIQSFPSLRTPNVKVSLSYASGHKRQKHNGPTAIGSPIYNKQDVEIRTIRSESSMSNNSPGQEMTTNPELRKQMDRITSEFRVVPSNGPSIVGGKVNCLNIVKKNYLLIPLNEIDAQDGEHRTVMPRSMLEGFHYRNNSYPNEHDEVNARKYINDLLEAGRERMNCENAKQQTNIPEVTIQKTQGTNFGRNIAKKPNNVGREEQSKQNMSNHLQNDLLGVRGNKSRPSSAASSRLVHLTAW